jgi:hypothetical protein
VHVVLHLDRAARLERDRLMAPADKSVSVRNNADSLRPVSSAWREVAPFVCRPMGGAPGRSRFLVMAGAAPPLRRGDFQPLENPLREERMDNPISRL